MIPIVMAIFTQPTNDFHKKTYLLMCCDELVSDDIRMFWHLVQIMKIHAATSANRTYNWHNILILMKYSITTSFEFQLYFRKDQSGCVILQSILSHIARIINFKTH